MKSLSIKNCSTYYAPVKLVNLIDFDPKKLKVNVVGTDELSIYYVEFDNGPLYLVVDDVKDLLKIIVGLKI